MKKILVIDDDEGIKDALKAILESEGFVVDLAADEKSLLKSDHTKPELIFLDYFLSGTTGESIAQTIRSNTSTKDIPIIMLSADPSNREKIPSDAINDFLDKPFEMTDLLTLTNKYIQS